MISIRRRCSKEIIRLLDAVCRDCWTMRHGRGSNSGPIFLTRAGKLIDRTYAAQVAEEKGNLRCLRKMYQATWEGIERNVTLLVERAQDRLLEEEQLTVGLEK